MRKHVCPWWFGPFLMNPLRRFAHNPPKILSPYVSNGMTVLDLGCGLGFFTFDLARLVGPKGKVIAVDLQPRMLKGVERGARKAGLLDRIETRLADADGRWAENLGGKVDFALAFFMAHEVPDTAGFLALVRSTLASGGVLLLAEPKMHVSACDYADTVVAAQKAGFTIADYPKIARSRAVLLSSR